MSLLNENITRQADEVEALSLIYGDEWSTIDDAARKYGVHITNGSDGREINFLVRMTDEYPIYAPPEYEINATWLRDITRSMLEDKLIQICIEHKGEDLVYLLAESVREYLQNLSDGEVPSEDSNADALYVDDFDPSILGDFTTLSLKSEMAQFSTASCPEIIHGETLTDRKSTFQPHLAVISDKAQVSVVMSKLYENKKIANATHNMLAYRIVPDEGGPVYQGCDDDGETHAGSRMLHLLQVMNAENVLVVVSRWYGGIHLGPDRFKHINNCTRQILEANGFSREKDKKIGTKKGKKVR